MFPGECEAVISSHHQAIVLPDKLTNGTDMGLACKPAELNCGLRMTLAGEDTAVDGSEGEHVSWAAEIRSGDVRVGKLPASQGAVMSRDPGGRAHGVVA